MHNTEQHLPKSSPLELVQARLDHWRATRKKRTSIPKEIWSNILDLLNDHSMSKISKALKISYEQLNVRINADRPTNTTDDPIAPNVAHELSFVELERGITDASSNTLEITNPNGLTMTVRTSNKELISSIAQLFCRDNHATSHAAA